jgi:hypothetical protein
MLPPLHHRVLQQSKQRQCLFTQISTAANASTAARPIIVLLLLMHKVADLTQMAEECSQVCLLGCLCSATNGPLLNLRSLLLQEYSSLSERTAVNAWIRMAIRVLLPNQL